MKKQIGQRGLDFSISERRILGLQLGGQIKGKESEALRKLIDAFPWLLEIAECNYDESVAFHSFEFEKSKILKKHTIQEYFRKIDEQRRRKD